MKSIPQNVLLVIGCIIIVIVILSVFGIYSTKVPPQRQVIHIVDQQGLVLSNPNGLIKISEIKPNSMFWFNYPDPDRFKNRDPFERFLLIRLPDYLGGTASDASAFRAYSAIDPSSHCLIKYWPEEGRKRIEDPCGGNMYEPVSGHAIFIGGNPILISKNLALPYLVISVDEDGFLYAETPVWIENRNGIIGIGRNISEQEIKSTNELIVTKEKQIRDAMEKFGVPEHLSTGHNLDNISSIGMRKNIAEYVDPDLNQSYISLSYEYCNCTKSKELLADEEMTMTNSQILDLDEMPVVAYPNKVNYVNNIHDDYTFVFYHNGYKISLYTNQKLDAGLNLIKELLAFEDK
jgi:hypothetical protein